MTRLNINPVHCASLFASGAFGADLATILLYADLYFTCLFFDTSAFHFEQGTGSLATTNVVSVWVAMLYFSVSTVTCTGFGDIYVRF